MAITEKLHTTTGTASDTYSFPFPYFKESDVVVEIDNVIQDQSTKYTFHTATEIKFTSGNIPASGKALKIYRDTNVDNAKAVFSTGSSIRATDLNNNFDQTLYSDQELVYTKDITSEAVTSAKIRNLTIVNEDISTTAEIDVSKLADGSARQIIQTAANGNDVEWTSNVDVPGTLDVTGATDLDGTLNVDGATTLAATTATTLSTTGNTTIGGNLDVTGTFDVTGTSNYTGQQTVPGGALVKNIRVGLDNANEVSTSSGSLILDSNTGTVEITDHLNVTGNADVDNNLNVDGTLTVDGTSTLTGNVIVTGTVDGRDLEADGTKLDGIEAGAKGDQTVAEIKSLLASDNLTDAHLAADSVGTSELKSDSVGSTELKDDSVGTDQIEANSINNGMLINATIQGGKIANNTINYANIQNVSATNKVLGRISSGAGNVEELSAGNIKTIYESNSDTNPLTDAEKAVIDGVTANTSELNILDGVTSSTAELNLLDGKSIVTSIASNATDVQLPSAQAVNERITSIVSDIGGFVPVLDELKFPNSNPDPDGDAGTIVSIADAGGIVVGDGNGGTVAGRSTTARALDGSTVTINDIDSSLHGTTIAAGKGMLVETTSTTHTYTYHRLVVDEAGVAAAQTLVTDFNQRYRVGATNPGDSLDDGDLFFNTTSNKMLVYNATGTSWDEVAGSSGNFTICSLTSVGSGSDSPPGGSATFNGTAQKFGLSGAGNSAQQHIVSINGVIQKPNTGSSVPSEGFALSGSTIIFSSAPAAGSDFFIIAIGKSVEIGTPSNNSITSAMIIDGSITGGDIATDTITEAKLDIHQAPSDGKFLKYTSSNGMEWGDVPAGVGGATGVDFNDGVKARWGTGNDLEIYHDSGGNTFIKETGSGSLVINADDFYLQDVATNTQIKSVSGGAVELYHNGTKKFQTTSSGVHCFGQLEMDGSNNIDLQDNGAILLGDSDDLQIYHNGSHSFIADEGDGQLTIKSNGAGIELQKGDTEFMGRFITDGSVQLYYDNARKLSTYSSGVEITGTLWIPDGSSTGNRISVGNSSDLLIYHDATNTLNFIDSVNGNLRIRVSSTENAIQCKAGDAVELYFDDSKKLETNADGIKVVGDIVADDNKLIKLGNDGDLKLYHSGVDSYIKDTGTGQLILQSDEFRVRNAAGDELIILADEDGAVKLYYDGVQKFETLSTGWGVANTIEWHATQNSLDFYDSKKASFGSSRDLQIYHDGSHSWIENVNASQNLIIESQATTGIRGSVVHLTNVDGSHTLFEATGGGAVDLYHNNSKKLWTTSGGIEVTGRIKLTDAVYFVDHTSSTNGMALFGSDNDMKMYHNGSHGFITNITGQIHLRGSSTVHLSDDAGYDHLKATKDGSVELYYDGGKKFETTAKGITIHGSIAGSSDAQSNTLLGTNAGDSFSGTGANNNTLIGKNAGTAITLGDGNTVVGTSAFMTAEGASNNTAIGKDACGLQTTASNNVAVGTAALYDCTTGGNNTAIGSWALENSTTAGSNTAVGHGCFRDLTTSNNNTAIGYEAAKRTTTGYNVHAFGIHAAQYNTTGYELVAIGNNALNAHTTGHKNVAVGGGAGYNITTGTANTCVGNGANGGTTASYNCSFGLNALAASTTGNSNIAIGVMAGDAITTGSNNIAIGYDALTSCVTGTKNVAIGSYAGLNNTSDESVFIGYQAGQGNTSGYYNIAIGHNAGYHLSTSVNSILIGYNAGNPASPSGQVDDDSNTLCLGNDNISNFYCADTSISSSDQRDKTDITNFTPGLSFIKQLRPVTYRWDKRSWYVPKNKVTQAQIDNGEFNQDQLNDIIPATKDEFLAATPDGSKKDPKQHVGFVAQEVLAVEQSAGFASDRDSMLTVNLTKDETQYGMKYERLVPILVNAIKELETRIATLEAA